MKCPSCGSENLDRAQRCTSCGHVFHAVQGPLATVDVKISRIAIVSSICALIGAILFLPSLIAELDPRVLRPPQSHVAFLTGLATFLASGSAFLLGIAGLVEIATNGGRRTGYGFAVIGVVTPFVLVVGLSYVPSFGRVKSTHYSMSCGTNLSGIGKAMLIYANDYKDELPLAGGRGTTWGTRLNDWTAASRSEAFGLDPNNAGGQATISSSLYLLVRYGGLAPKAFVCEGDRGTRPFDPDELPVERKDLETLWDFGPDPAMHCSYSYHMPYGLQKLTTSNESNLPVVADRNPWIDGPRWKAGNFSKFQWNGPDKQQRAGNAVAHRLDGQNVLFLDSHVEFAKRSFCGIDNDNIYTLWNGQDKARGTPPKLGSQPADRLDSLLVNDPAVPRR